jgi:hypothetical protein
VVVNAFLVWSSSPRASLYSIRLVAQLIVCSSAVLGWVAVQLRLRLPLLHIPLYFAIANMAALCGMLLSLRGERRITWDPRR